jgi:predicted secreted Zn-dependent protease
MAKALVGYRVASDPRLVLETVELRRRVRDLEHLVEALQRDNDRLRENDRVRDDVRQPDVVGAAVPTIAG